MKGNYQRRAAISVAIGLSLFVIALVIKALFFIHGGGMFDAFTYALTLPFQIVALWNISVHLAKEEIGFSKPLVCITALISLCYLIVIPILLVRAITNGVL